MSNEQEINPTKNDFTQGSIPSAVMRMAIPMIGAQIVNALYSIVDRMYIGQLPGVGKMALTGVGLTFPFIMIVSAFAMLAGMGGAPLCSIARGKGENAFAERVMGSAFTLLMFLGVLLTVLSLLVKDVALVWFGASVNTFSYANEYITIYLWGSLFVMITLGMNPFINSQGFSRIGMMTVALGAVANIVLDPFFMYVLKMGVKGAALATVLAQALSAAWVMRFLTGDKCILRLKRCNLRPDFAILKRIVALGASTCTMNITDSMVSILCNRTLFLFGGDVYVTVMTVISSVRQVLMMPMGGFGQGLQPVMGYNYGAKRYDRVRESFRFTLIVCTLYASAVCALTLSFPGFFIGLFNSDPELLAVGIPSMRLYFCLFFMMALQMSGQYSFVALGKSRHAMFFSLLRKAFIVAPLTLLLPRVTSLGVMGVFAAEPISDFIGSSACIITFILTMRAMLKKEAVRPAQ
ncbi:MAG: MATE family efflux transporter [Clostridia bacterium]